MKQDIKKYTVTIFDTTYTIRSDEPEQHIKLAAEHVDYYMKEIAQKAPLLDQKTIAILVAVQLASRMIFLETSLQKREQQEQELIEKITIELSASASLSE